MKFSRKEIRDQAGESGWEADMLEKAVRLLLLLDLIERHPFLRGKLLLKGGTALNLFHLDVPRLSVDIDLNYVGAVDLDETTAQRPEIERAIAAIAQSEGYRLTSSADAHAGRKLYLQYANFSGINDRVEVDLNFMFRIPLFPAEPHASKGIMPGFGVQFPLVSWQELVAGKCVAAVGRVAARDIFDLAQLRSRIDMTDARLRAAWIGLSALLPHALSDYDKSRFRRVNRKELDTTLLPFLRAGRHDDFDSIVPAAESLLGELLTLGESEKQFVLGIAEGRIDSGLLLPLDSAFGDNLQRHPALLWKIENVRKHLGEKGK